MSSYVIDEQVLVQGLLRDERLWSRIRGARIIVPKGLVRWLERSASRGDRTHLAALAELARLRELEKEGEISALELAEHAKSGVDALEELAKPHGATVLTGDSIRAVSLRLRGVRVEYVGPKGDRLAIEEFFTEDTMSVHLKEGAPPMAKRGRPGEFRLVKLREEPLTTQELQK
ncbi:MAG: hypothetical protein QI223_01915, partial [Candidatus Korarchaeota archaeon]|nr:hypothetical protein [Candidatus Korarchaeota archaeon]